jgi:hypothetical protein
MTDFIPPDENMPLESWEIAYTVRRFNPLTGDISAATDFNKIRLISDARQTARLLAKGAK